MNIQRAVGKDKDMENDFHSDDSPNDNLESRLWKSSWRCSHNPKKNAETNKSILTRNGRPLLMSEQPKRRINHTLAAVRISMEVLRLGPDVEPLPHERLGPWKLHTWKRKREKWAADHEMERTPTTWEKYNKTESDLSDQEKKNHWTTLLFLALSSVIVS